MAKLEYHNENQPATWVCLVGKNSTIWFAYTSLTKALFKMPILAWRFKNHG